MPIYFNSPRSETINVKQTYTVPKSWMCVCSRHEYRFSPLYKDLPFQLWLPYLPSLWHAANCGVFRILHSILHFLHHSLYSCLSSWHTAQHSNSARYMLMCCVWLPLPVPCYHVVFRMPQNSCLHAAHAKWFLLCIVLYTMRFYTYKKCILHHICMYILI